MGKKYIYKAFGLTFSSEIEIPEFTTDEGEEVVRIYSGTVPAELKEKANTGFRYQINKNEFLLQFNPWAQFYLRNGNEITYCQEKGADERDTRAFLLSIVMSVLFQQRNALPVHSGSICFKGKAVLFAGNSGTGKSTLAMLMNRQFGYKINSDDVTVISDIDGMLLINSSFPSVKLWRDSIDLLGIDFRQLRPVRNGSYKYRYNNPEIFNNEPLLPYAIVFLNNNTLVREIQLSEVKGSAKFRLLGNLIYYGRITGSLYAQEQLALMSALLSKVKCYEINIPSGGSGRDNLAGIINSILCSA